MNRSVYLVAVRAQVGYNQIVKSSYWTAAAGAALALPAYCGLMLDGVPTLRCPLPTLTVMPALFLSNGRLTWLAVLVPAGLFFLWSPGPFSRHGRYSEALMDIASSFDRFDSAVFCRQLELRFEISREAIYLRYLRVECGMAGTALDDFYVEREQTVIYE
jgi:hypothetical protein